MAKKIYLLKCLTAICLFIATAVEVNAQVTRTSTKSGDWADANIWTPAGVPALADNVIIASGHAIEIGSNQSSYQATCTKITFAGGTAGADLSMANNNSSLTISEGIIMHSNTTLNTSNRLRFVDGSVTCAYITVDATSHSTIQNLLNLENTVNVTGNITMGNTGIKLTVAATGGRLNIGGAITGGTLQFDPGGSIVDYNGTGSQTMRTDEPYSHLILSGSGSKTGAVTVNDRLSLEGTATLGNAITYSSAILEYKGSQAQTESANEFLNSAFQLTEIIINNPSGVTFNQGKGLGANLTLAAGTLTAPGMFFSGLTPRTLTRSGGSFNGTLNSGSSYSIIYTGNSKQTGPELSGTVLNNVTINLNSGESLTLDQDRSVKGTLTINNGSRLIASDHTLSVGGNWSNNGTFTQTNVPASQVVLNGAAGQTIEGASNTAFANLVINNSSTGITLNSPFSLLGSMTFQDGIVMASNTNYPTFNDGATVAGAGASGNSFVSGPVAKKGDDAFVFPIGKNGSGYHPATIGASSILAAEFKAEYLRGNAALLGSISTPDVLNVSNCEYWQITRVSSNATPSLTLSWNAGSVCNSPAQYVTSTQGLKVVGFDGSSWSNGFTTTQTNGDNTSGTVLTDQLTDVVWGTHTYYTIGNMESRQNPLGGPLPVRKKTSVATGDWDKPGTWTPAGIPSAIDEVEIGDGHTVTIPSSIQATCKAVTFIRGTQSSALLVSGSGSSLTVNGDIITNIPPFSQNNIVISNAARLNIAGTITGTGVFQTDPGSTVNYNGTGATQAMWAGTYSNLVLSGAGTKTGAVTVNDTLCLAGAATAGNVVTYSSAVLEYKGSQAQTTSVNEFPVNIATTNLVEIIINNPNGVTVTTPTRTLNANLTLTAGTLTAGNNITIGTTTPTITRGNGSFSGSLGTVAYHARYTGNSKQTGEELSGTGLTNVTIDLNTGEDSLALNQSRNPKGDLALNSGIFDLGPFAFSRMSPGGRIDASANTILRIGGTGTLPAGFSSYAFAQGNTVEYNGTDQTVGITTYGNLALKGDGNKNVPQGTGNFVIHNLLVDSFTTFSTGGYQVRMNSSTLPGIATINGKLYAGTGGFLITGTVAAGNGKTLKLGAGSIFSFTGVLPSFATYNFDPNSTVVYNSTAGSQQISITPFYGNLVFSGSGEKVPSGGSTLTVRGSLTIDPNNSFNGANRTVNVGGDWINDGSFTNPSASASTLVKLNGSGTQTIKGASNTTFFKLEINKTFAADSVILSQSITVSNNLSLQKGILFSNSSSLPIIQDNATVTGASDNSFVDGPLRKIGDDDFTFPIGKAEAGFHKIGIDIIGTANGTTEFTAQFFKSNPQALSTTLGPGLEKLSACEFWTLDRNGTNQARVILSWEATSPCNGPYVTDPTKLRVAHLLSGEWKDEGRFSGTGNNTAGTITSNVLTGFSPFALASNSASENLLPVVFGDVKAYEKNGAVQIEWSNLTEKDVVEYTIERSVNGQDFSSIAKQWPTNNQNDKATYTGSDAVPVAGTNYYRIKVVETTGKIVYSKILSVNLGRANVGLELYPNPVIGNQVTITLSNLKHGQYHLRVLNATGQDIFQKRIVNQSRNLTQTLNLPSNIKPGVYNMVITADDYRETKIFIVR